MFDIINIQYCFQNTNKDKNISISFTFLIFLYLHFLRLDTLQPKEKIVSY